MRRRQTKHTDVATQMEAMALNNKIFASKAGDARLNADGRELLRVTHEAVEEMIRKLFTPQKAKSA